MSVTDGVGLSLAQDPPGYTGGLLRVSFFLCLVRLTLSALWAGKVSTVQGCDILPGFNSFLMSLSI